MSPAERHVVQVRLAEDAGEADHRGNVRVRSRGLSSLIGLFLRCDNVRRSTVSYRVFDGFKLAIRDAKAWIFMLLSCSQAFGFSFGNFFPTWVSNVYHAL